jgi:hypothetical protein
VTDDLVTLQGAALGPITGYTPSPVQTIDGVDVVSFLLAQSLVGQSQDPDALWNQVFFQLGNQNANAFVYPTYYPGPTTNVTFANGTTLEITNAAVVNLPLDGVTTGDDAYASFCPGALETASATSSASAAATSSSAPSTASASATSAPPSSPTVFGYPYPVIKHSADSVAGYYLNTTGQTDVAVLQVQSFSAEINDPLNFELEFQMVVQKFFDAAVKTGKSKLIIDLQGNGGRLPSSSFAARVF